MSYKFSFNFLLIIVLVSCGGGGSGAAEPEPPSIFNPAINTFTVSESSISVGSSITLSWTTTNAIECSGSGDWEGQKTTGSGNESLTLTEVKTYTFTLTCRGESPQNTVSQSLSVQVNDTNNSGSDIYAEDKSSYCKEPENTGSNYWIEEFDSEILNEEYFSYEVGNGFLVMVSGLVDGEIMNHNITQAVKKTIQNFVMNRPRQQKTPLLKMDI